MRKEVSEQTVLFVSVVKWVLFASFVGVVVGCAVAGFVHALEWSTLETSKWPYALLALPFVLVAVVIIKRKVFPQDDVETTDRVIDAIHKEEDVSLKSALKAFFLPIFTIAFGGSAGKEALCADVGASIGSTLSRRMKLSAKDRQKFMVCGVSAGFASVFGTPIAGALFGVEILFVGGILYEVLLPSIIAGIVSYHVSTALGITYFSYPLEMVPVFSDSFLITVVAAGIIFGLISYLMIEFFRRSKKVADAIPFAEPVKAFLAGTIIVVLAILISRDYLGLGLDGMEAALTGVAVVWYAFLLKILFTSLTLSFGGSGGVITPALFVGATAGAALGAAVGADTATFAAIGLVSVLAGVANAPISASVLAIELFGPTIAPYAAVAAVISFLMTGHRSIFPSQILAIKKSESIEVETGKKLSQVKPKAKPRKEGALKNLMEGIEQETRIGELSEKTAEYVREKHKQLAKEIKKALPLEKKRKGRKTTKKKATRRRGR